MAKVQSIFLPILATVTPTPDAFTGAGDIVIDTNVPGVILYTLDGSLPAEGEFGTFKAAAPVTITLKTTTELRFKAIDSRSGQDFNYTKIQTLVYTVVRTNPVEAFRDNFHFFKRLYNSIVDKNFYLGDSWVVPVSSKPYTYLYINKEGFPALVRVLQNGVDTITDFPRVENGFSREFPMTVTTGDVDIEIQTNRQGPQ